MKLLLTAFEPFGGEAVNAAQQAVMLLPGQIGGIEITRMTVPTVFRRAIESVMDRARELQPDVILCVGQAAGRAAITPERAALNVDDARIPDNDGNQPQDQPIFADGENALFSTLPVKAMVEAIRQEGIPAQLSNSAGTFVCNHLMYGVLYHCARELPGTRAGFIHVPYTAEQAVEHPGPCLSRADIARGLFAAIRTLEKL